MSDLKFQKEAVSRLGWNVRGLHGTFEISDLIFQRGIVAPADWNVCGRDCRFESSDFKVGILIFHILLI
jgi:hypothetical protein